jgi:hypothetical protein
MISRAIGSLAVALAMLAPAAAHAAPVTVRFTEGVVRAFPVLRATDNRKLAQGDLVQVVRGDRIESRLVFRFQDGSLFDETVVFSQDRAFTLLSYRIVQRGPSFPETLEASVDRESGRYEVRYRADEDSPEEVLSGAVQLPDDVYNGMLSLIVKNLPPRTTGRVSIVAFTPKPRVISLELQPLAEERVQVRDVPLTATRYHIRPMLGLLASLLVVDLPDVRMWVLPGDAPAFLRAEGPLYFMGPVWRIEPY